VARTAQLGTRGHALVAAQPSMLVGAPSMCWCLLTLSRSLCLVWQRVLSVCGRLQVQYCWFAGPVFRMWHPIGSDICALGLYQWSLLEWSRPATLFRPFQRFAWTLPFLVAHAQDAPSGCEQFADRLSASHYYQGNVCWIFCDPFFRGIQADLKDYDCRLANDSLPFSPILTICWT
jgi:hypothetical protein